MQPTIERSSGAEGRQPAIASALVPDLFRIARRLRRMGGHAQMDVAALLVLHRLACEEPRRPSDLAADLGLDLSTVSRHVRALDDAGLVTREADPTDGRSFHLSVTPEGTALLVESLQRRERGVQRALEGWDTDDVTELRRLLGRLADDLERTDEETR
jgi:DNA-binding MarR family transcriptional regulator